ncbi:MAG: T9SS type A sorting domain-containing protein [Bacteroidia bacterium]|nr:T9SS type A sorting domain-containing protein [Bacteroidia bacterium]
MKKIYVILFFHSLVFNNLSAQSLTPFVVASSGGFFSNSSGMLSETIGELAAVTTLSSANNFLTQGFQQPSDFGTGVSSVVSPFYSVSVFPNPGEGIFNIVIHSDRNESLELSIYDMLGKKIIRTENNITAGKNIFRIEISQHAPRVYLLECLFNNPKNA